MALQTTPKPNKCMTLCLYTLHRRVFNQALVAQQNNSHPKCWASYRQPNLQFLSFPRSSVKSVFSLASLTSYPTLLGVTHVHTLQRQVGYHRPYKACRVLDLSGLTIKISITHYKKHNNIYSND